MLCNLKSHPVSSGMLPLLFKCIVGRHFARGSRLFAKLLGLEPPPRLERGLTDYKSVRLPLADRGIFRSNSDGIRTHALRRDRAVFLPSKLRSHITMGLGRLLPSQPR